MVRWCRLSGARLVPSSWSAGDVLGVLEKVNFGTPGHFPPLSLPFVFVSGGFGAVLVGSQVLVALRNAAQAAGVLGQ